MRILYVALTRAKEKLIITGTVNNVPKERKAKSDNLSIYELQGSKMNPILLKKYISYLDWILLVYMTSDLKENLSLHFHEKNEFEENQIVEEQRKELCLMENVDIAKIDKEFDWQYPNKTLIDTPMKLSVSQIKAYQNKQEERQGLEEVKAKFATTTNQLTPAQKGTVMHYFLQKLDFTKKYTKEELQKFAESLVLKKAMTELEAKSLDLEKVYQFVTSEIYARIMQAKQIEKEKPFCINIPVEEFNGNEISVQGIMDLFFIDINEKMVLVDYKTDFVRQENELREKYAVQLDIYQKALEESLGKKVDEVYIYSIFLNKFIKM